MRFNTLLIIALAASGGQTFAQQIYTCVDAKGRTLTADRPIVECLDRTQRELSPSGVVRRQVGPTLTAQEQMLQEEKEKLAAEQRVREASAKRRDRTLVLRYPNAAAHEKDRLAALAQADEVIQAAKKTIGGLLVEHRALATEFEFYAKDLSLAPEVLRLSLEENKESLEVQQKIILDQTKEKRRLILQYDEELAKLKELWALQGAASGRGKN